ncbi:MAG: GNAT family N-acetyltransferase [Candidatus Riflebacteria bacterium]|nr:GNAT family N-acetyltransferase [Candidatus Riflebacteria bacterium]
MDIEIRTFNGKSPDFALAMEIRQKVFVVEQHVPENLEHDEFDEQAMHVLLLADGLPVGTGRFFADPQRDETARLGRVAVLREYRGLRLGQVLIATLLDEIKKSGRFCRVLIHAQTAVVELYARFGFEKIGEEFYEAGIAHYEMIYLIK